MKGKGLPVYFVQPTQMHKECSLATLDCYGNFFFSCERPSIVTGIFFSRANDPRLLREIFFLVQNTLDCYGKFFFSCETPLIVTGNFFFSCERPSVVTGFFFLVQTTLLPQKD